MRWMRIAAVALVAWALTMAQAAAGPKDGERADRRTCISGVYPHLAMFNHDRECGLGAVVPWADRLWVITYSPHRPKGSDDKLYEIDRELNLTIRTESVGGTPANRMIHRESDQLIIGPYFIDAKRNVRVVPPSKMPGRHTATARHLTAPKEKVYFLTMEEGLYEVDVRTLAVRTLYPDIQAKDAADLLPGRHGKGGYTSQGRLVVSNNGEKASIKASDGPAGCLAEWDGKDWHVVERKQFVEVTGPGGIHGNAKTSDPLWATGWDKRSVILKLLDGGEWRTFRLPRASNTYDASHGWFTEWPRIREIGDGRMLMTMHGMFWEFPKGFRAGDTAGIRPLSCYLKIVADWCLWDGRLAFACDDAAITGGNYLVGQSQSNLWFVDPAKLDAFGPAMGTGGPWLDDPVKAGRPSEPFLLAGFDRRMIHLAHDAGKPVTFTLEIDARGDGRFKRHDSIEVPAKGYAYRAFPADLKGQWIRVTADRDCAKATAWFSYCNADERKAGARPAMMASLADAGKGEAYSAGLIRPRGEDLGTLHMAARTVDKGGRAVEAGYYEIASDMKLRRIDNAESLAWLKDKARIKGPDFQVDEASVIVTDRSGRFRLPKGAAVFDRPGPLGASRGVREVVTERNLLNCHGTFYELPQISSGGLSRIKPVCTHNRRIFDYCSWRGMMVISGCRSGAEPDGHFVASDDGKVGLWFGAIDDLWQLGKPVGVGGPWKQTQVKAGDVSDPYLMTGYDVKRLLLRHDAKDPVRFTVEVDLTGGGHWQTYATLAVPGREDVQHEFPCGYGARWVRLRVDRPCRATAQFTYE